MMMLLCCVQLIFFSFSWHRSNHVMSTDAEGKRLAAQTALAKYGLKFSQPDVCLFMV
jgi:hypothetical protein